ncbi:LLM class flavin-dependent oxidoreductase [Microbacterium sp. 2FI]|uniref:LLM class flavin-dependent oxidoreductase n=1 Tax=Microbacterium sp. 2FI TaxID=2502193 RepID=UPI0010F5373F|nr:LLM class flavin-dependent oxidoreductase [Microbacterium sp. 2FI]
MTGALSIGIAAALGPDVAARIAPAIEGAGFHSLWVNDTAGSDALEVLAAVAAVTDRLMLATGVLPVDRRTPDEILERVAALELPAERLVLGIGSGGAAVGALARVTEAVDALRAQTTARVMVGALGPKMRERGAAASDGLVLSWLTPALAARQTAEAHAVAAHTHTALYVRTATDPDAEARLDAETARYAGYPSYAANFARLEIAAEDTVIRPGSVGAGITAYRSSADEVVLRAITAEDAEADYRRFIDDVAAVI